jgi:drug/metabolite transporter (DMT)-like permease
VTQGKRAARWQLFASGLAFGLMAALVRLASRDAAGFSGPQMATVRFGIGTAAMLVWFRVRPGSFVVARPGLLATRGLLGGAAALLYFFALARIPAAEATLINNTFPVLATIVSIFTLGERPTIHLAAAMVTVALGVALVLGPGTPYRGVGAGELFAVAGAVAAGLSVTSIRALRHSSNAATIFFAFCAGGLVVSVPLAGGPWPHSPTVWAIAVTAAVLSTLGQLLMTMAYGALTVAEAALWQQLTPVAAYAWALPLLDEHLTTIALAGILIGVVGVGYGTVLGHRAAGTPVPPALAVGDVPARRASR